MPETSNKTCLKKHALVERMGRKTNKEAIPRELVSHLGRWEARNRESTVARDGRILQWSFHLT